MKNEKSWTRRQYIAAYKLMRQGIEFEQLNDVWSELNEITRAADYSYQAKDHFVTGWTSGIRFEKFYQGIQTCKYSTWSIPF